MNHHQLGSIAAEQRNFAGAEEQYSAGQWHLLVDKPTTSDEILKALVPKMLALPAAK